MAPGPPDRLSNNRFSVLGDFLEIPSKKHKSNAFPNLPTPTTHNNANINPKYVVITSTDTNKEISKLSPFAIKKGLEGISTEINSISALRDGSLLILARNDRIADKFLRSKSLGNLCPIACKLHETLNSVKGVIYAPCLIHVPEAEIVKEMKDQGVSGVYKFTRPSEDGNSRIATGKIIVTFNLYRLPTTVDVAWYKCKVDYYIPNPMRCKNCQRLGHTRNHCKSIPTCPKCSLPPHALEECTRVFCTNCSGEHPSTDNNCPRFKQMKEILKIKTQNYCSIGEARRKYKETHPTLTTMENSYAETTFETPTKRKEASVNQMEKNTPSQILNDEHRTETNHDNNTNISTTCKVNTTTKSNGAKTKTAKITEENESNKQKTSKNHNNNSNSSLDTKNSTLISPISSLTQTLINKDDYFIPLSDEESLEGSPLEM